MGKKHDSQYANFGWLPAKVRTADKYILKQKRHKVMYITSYLWRFRFSHFPVLDSARFGNLHLIWQLGSFPYLIEK